MALSNYAQLKSAIADWMERGDLADRTSDFIALAESRLNRLVRFRALETDQPLTAVAGSRFVALPATFREPVALWREAATGREPVRFVEAGALPVAAGRGPPTRWTIDGGQLAFERPCDQAYALSLRMLGRLALGDDAPTNPVLADYPDLYLFGGLVEAAPYLRDAELLSLFAVRFEAALAEARAKESRSRGLTRLSAEPGLVGCISYDARG